MNKNLKKFFKMCVVVFGAINVVMSIMIPVLVASLVVNQTELSTAKSTIILCAGFGASLFRSIKYFID